MSRKLSVLMTGVALAGMLAFTSAHAASVTDADSPHNMLVPAASTTATGNEGVDASLASGRVCVFCHVPHNFATDAPAPLWNRADPSGPFTPYSSSTLDAGGGTAPSPTGVSLACLSCHDGVTAFNALLQNPGVTLGTNTTMTDIAGTNAVVGPDLSNDHPVSIVTTADSAINTPATIIAAGVPLFGGGNDTVQCASCHNPHDYGDTAPFQPFMRISNDASALCTTCHIK